MASRFVHNSIFLFKDYSTVNTSVTTESPLTPTPNCWTPETTPFAQSMAWTVYGYIYEIGMKIVPASIIGILNFLMLLKLNKVTYNPFVKN